MADIIVPDDDDDSVTVTSASVKDKPEVEASSHLQGLDRRQMEADRLARLKRKREDFAIGPEPATGLGRSLVNSISPPPTKKSRVVLPDTSKQLKSSKVQLPPTNSHAQNHPTSGIQYPKGVVKKTWAFNHERRGDDIKIEEVLQKSTLQCALLSAFCLDLDWILPKLNLQAVKVCLVMHAQQESEKAPFRDWAESSNGRLRVCFPWIAPAFSCMHSKLQLLFHDTHLRIAIPTANLVNFDWGEPPLSPATGQPRSGATMENMVFLIDLPKLPPSASQSRKDLPFFGQELDRFLHRQTVPSDIRAALLRYDFSATAPYAFVHTMAGRHIGDSWRHTGVPGLGRAVRALGLATDRELEIEYVGSSLGTLDHAFVEAMYRAAQGDDGLKVCMARAGAGNARQKTLTGTGAVAAAPATATADLPWDLLERRFRIYFPTAEGVARSFAGASGAGSLFLAGKAYAAPKFPRELMRDCVSTREGLLMHNKLLFVRSVQGKARAKTEPVAAEEGEREDGAGDEMREQERPLAWAYVGSANFSRNAWGSLVMKKEKGATAAEPCISPSNWECGVIFPVPAGELPAVAAGEAVSMDVFRGHVPVPMVVPGARYGDRKPWTSS